MVGRGWQYSPGMGAKRREQAWPSEEAQLSQFDRGRTRGSRESQGRMPGNAGLASFFEFSAPGPAQACDRDLEIC